MELQSVLCFKIKRPPTRIQNLNSQTWIIVSCISKYSCYRVYKIDCEFGKWFQWQKLRKYYEDFNVGLNGSYWFSWGLKLCSHANGFGVAGIFPADIVSCITSTCTLLHAKPRFMHWNVTGNADARQTMFPRLCFHDQIFYATVISSNNPQGVKAA